MFRTVLITRPNHDLTTNYLYYWCQPVIDEANSKGFKLLDLKSDKANKKNLESYIKKHKPALVFLNGHGSSDCITGYQNEELISLNNNEYILAGTIVYALSCDVAKKLGGACVEKGALTFVGYCEKYYLASSRDRTTEPLKDTLARLFLEPSNLVPISIIKGNTVKKAHNKSQQAMKRNLNFMLSTKASKEQQDCAFALFSNMKNQIIIGDEESKIN